MLRTPYFLVDERRLVDNLAIVRRVRDESGAKSVLALKCFSTWSVFGLMRAYLDGTTSSSVHEARLGREEFGGEVHAYSVAFTASPSSLLSTGTSRQPSRTRPSSAIALLTISSTLRQPSGSRGMKRWPMP